MSRASRKLPLRGWYVISLRPLHQHGGVRRSAAALGARVFAISTLRLQPLATTSTLACALACERIVVTSPAAARYAGAQMALGARPGQHWFALGAGTAATLRRLGVGQVLLPAAGSDSESLLAHPQLQDVAGQSIGVLTAPGGRALLAQELAARGANVVTAMVYQRQALPVQAARCAALSKLPDSSALLLTSEEAFSLLWAALDPAARARLLERPCVVASDRLSAHAAALGFRCVLRARDPSPPGLLAALLANVGTPGFG